MQIFFFSFGLWEEITGNKASKSDVINSGKQIPNVLPIPVYENNAYASLYLTTVF